MNSPTSNCPKCQADISAALAANQSNCPACGTPLTIGNAPPTPPKTNWPLFFGLLLAPAVLNLIAASVDSLAGTIFFTLLGSGLAGVKCADIMARHLGGSRAVQFFLNLVFLPLFAAVSFGLCYAGCALHTRLR